MGYLGMFVAGETVAADVVGAGTGQRRPRGNCPWCRAVLWEGDWEWLRDEK